jgi:DnaK suppressor protein
MLTADQMMDFEELLDDLIARLQKEIENSSADTAAVAPDNAIGRVSRMDSILSQEVAKAMVAAKQKRILDLHAARHAAAISNASKDASKNKSASWTCTRRA